MANVIRIKRSVSTNSPGSLAQGELAFSEDDSPNGLHELFIGTAGATVTKITTDDATTRGGTAAAPNDSNQDNQTLTTGTGISGADGGSSGDFTISLDYLGLDNFIKSATNLEGTGISSSDVIIYHDATDNNVKRGLVSDLPSSGGEANQTLTTGTGISGAEGGSSGDITFALDFSELTDMTGNIAGTTEFIIQDGTTESRKAASEIQLSFFNNDSGWEANDPNTVLTTSTGSASWNWIIDEDNMSSDSAAHVPTQQSVKAYVDTAVASGVTYKGGYNAATNTPDLDTTPSGVLAGDMYTVTAAGTFFTTDVEIGDVLIAEQDNATLESHWTIVERNLEYATETVAGYIEIATQAEVDGASDTTRAVVPGYLHNTTFDGGTF